MNKKASQTKSATNGKKANTLAIDIGGTGLKAAVLDHEGAMITERLRIKTPANCPPKRMVDILAKLVAPFTYDRVSVGFPGVVRRGRILTAHNLGTKAWRGFDLDLALTKKLGKPVRVLNDADIQGLGAICGKGVELVITLGTGMGSSLFEDGRLSSHLELAHHPFRKGRTYEEELGKVALEKNGKRKWNSHVARAIEVLRDLTNFDHLYIGGGNAANVKLENQPDVSLVSNELGMRGGIWLWRERGAGSTDIFRSAGDTIVNRPTVKRRKKAGAGIPKPRGEREKSTSTSTRDATAGAPERAGKNVQPPPAPSAAASSDG